MNINESIVSKTSNYITPLKIHPISSVIFTDIAFNCIIIRIISIATETKTVRIIILESIIQLATKLGLCVTAEGVETPQQAEILSRLGCHQLQGYLLGTPVSVDRLAIYKENHQFA